MNTDCISPFEVEIPSEVLSDLHRRLTNTRWPPRWRTQVGMPALSVST